MTDEEKVKERWPDAQYEWGLQAVMLDDEMALGFSTLPPDATDAQHRDSAWADAARHMEARDGE